MLLLLLLLLMKFCLFCFYHLETKVLFVMRAATDPKRKLLFKSSTCQIFQDSNQDVPLEFISNDEPQNNAELLNRQCNIHVLKTEPSFYEDEKMEEMNSNQFNTSSVQCGGQKNQVDFDDSVLSPTNTSDCSNKPHIGQIVKTEPSHQDQDEEKFSLADLVRHFQPSASAPSSHVQKCKEPLSRSAHSSQKTETKKLKKTYSHDHCSKPFLASAILTVQERQTRADPCLLPQHQSDESFRKSRKLAANKRTHSGEKSYSCDQCNKSFSKSENLVRHNKRIHIGVKPYNNCTFCCKSFSFSSELVRHKRTHTGEKPFSCDQCDKSFSQSGHLIEHKRSHTGEKPYSCDQCNKSFSKSGNLVRHNNRFHISVKPYNNCTLCSKSFSFSSELVRHKRTHTGEKPFSCDQCDKSFSQSGHLIEHKRSHSGEKPYSCDQCNKSFSRSINLVRHKRTHTGEKPYSCDFCTKSFSRYWDLMRHKRTRTGEKPYSCDQCIKSFRQSGDLIVHKRIHTGEKPYSCDQCNKSFSQSGYLIVHKRIHTGEKPYSCDQCNKLFRSSGNLAKHKRIH